MQTFQIGANEAGQRFDKFLHKYLPVASTGFLYKMIRKKNITLNKKKAEGSEILSLGDTVECFFSDETFAKFSDSVSGTASNDALTGKFKDIGDDYLLVYRSWPSISIIYEDKYILILDKPSGILTQKADAEDLSLNEWLIGYLLSQNAVTTDSLKTFKPSVCNRLDRNTSGLVLCGKSLIGSQELSRMIREREIRKFYRLFVKGIVTEEEAGRHIAGYLTKDSATNRVTITSTKLSDTDSSYIETAYYPLETFTDRTYLEVELITGKTHQIRAHLASISHPLLGDYKYGNISWNNTYKKVFGIKVQLLHAYRMEFPLIAGDLSDLSGRIFTAPLPAIYEALCQYEI